MFGPVVAAWFPPYAHPMAGSVEADPRIGSEIAGYRIEALVGRGGMGVVYRAHDVALDRSVALKLISPDLAEDERFRERFLHESRVAASIDHANIVPIYDAGESRGLLYIAMRFVESTDLGALLEAEGALEPERALRLLGQAASALDAAHERGLVHRDVKPANMLLTEEAGRGEHVYLSDFGLARESGAREPSDTDETVALKASGSLGTIDYASPEQIEGKPADARADVYSLGCVLYETLTGQRPFGSDSPVAVLFGHLSEPPPRASEARPDLDAAIDGVVERAMAKDADARYSTDSELVDAAVGVLLGARRRRRCRVLAGAVIAVVVVVAAVVAAVLVTGGGGESEGFGDDWSRVVHDEAAFGGASEVFAMGLAAGASGLVAVGTDGRADPSFPETNAAVWTSPDGVSWTRVPDRALLGPGGQGINGVAFGETGFVAAGWHTTGDQSALTFNEDAAVWASPDGESWERVADPEGVFGGPPNEVQFGVDPQLVPTGQSMNDVVNGGPGFVAVGDDEVDGRAAVWTSPDGQSWSRVPADAQAFGSRRPEDGGVSLLGVAAAEDGRLVAVGGDWGQSDVGAVLLSADGVSWTRAPHDEAVFGGESSSTRIDDVVAGGPGFVAVGSEATPADADLDERFVPSSVLQSQVASRRGDADELRGAVWTSVDGLVWSRVPEERLPDVGGAKVQLYAVTGGGPGLVAVGRRESDRVNDPVVWTSPGGETWSPAADLEEALRQTGGQLMADVIAAGPGLVAVGADGSIAGVNTAVWTLP